MGMPAFAQIEFVFAHSLHARQRCRISKDGNPCKPCGAVRCPFSGSAGNIAAVWKSAGPTPAGNIQKGDVVVFDSSVAEIAPLSSGLCKPFQPIYFLPARISVQGWMTSDLILADRRDVVNICQSRPLPQ